MASALRSELDARLSVRSVAGWLLFLAAFRFLLDASVLQLAWLTTTMIVGGLTEVVVDAYGVRDDVTNLGVALPLLVGGGALLVLDDGAAWVSGLFLVAGLWIVLDVVQALRHEGVIVDDEPRDGREVYREYVGRRVHGALQDEPLTRRELTDELDADADAVDAAIDDLLAEGAIEHRGSALRVVKTSESGAPLDRLKRALRRIARPITIEFRSA
ncbi:hypothetical protein [Halomicrobium salinisoli]|uniref:hypothetical protein n=1 Tax=Halomicrobium salinisoli TaxID=2878391 RepID=UPI001CEFC641|nr:hypothetical protein [Halomicrobium salinisoli]